MDNGLSGVRSEKGRALGTRWTMPVRRHGPGRDGMEVARVVHLKRMILKRAQRDPKWTPKMLGKRQRRFSCTTKSISRCAVMTGSKRQPMALLRFLSALGSRLRTSKTLSKSVTQSSLAMPEIEAFGLQIDHFSGATVYLCKHFEAAKQAASISTCST